MDLLRPEIRGYCDASVAELRRKHGRTILINTNFPLHNFAKGRAATAHIFDPYPLKNKEALLQAWYPFQEQGYEGFMKAAAALHDRFPSHTIVVRPAPAEDIRPWQKLFEGKPRGMVSKDGNVVEWIRAADAIVQFNCTTAIEAFLLDVPSVAYRCVQSEIFDCPLAIACSSEAFTLDELFTQVQAAVSAADAGRPPERHWSKNRALIEDHLTSLEGPTACERIVAELRRRDFPPHPYTLPPVPLIKRIWRAWLRVVRRPDPSDLRFYREKFPGLELAEARAVAADFARITGRFAKVRITRAGPHLVRIAPA
jgi:hypothetical protein